LEANKDFKFDSATFVPDAPAKLEAEKEKKEELEKIFNVDAPVFVFEPTKAPKATAEKNPKSKSEKRTKASPAPQA
jgi:endo-alpha-1,4-polygalactosaminidase (GH114 family)